MTLDLEPVLTSVLSAVASAFNEAARPLALVHLSPGREPAFDNCCEDGGQLYLRVVDVYPTAGHGTSGFPQPDTAQRGVGCGVTMLAVQAGVGVLRCAATIDDQGVPPSGERMSEETGDAVADMALVLDVLACEVRRLPRVSGVKIGRWTPLGVQGGCHGGEWTFYLAVDPCLPC